MDVSGGKEARFKTAFIGIETVKTCVFRSYPDAAVIGLTELTDVLPAQPVIAWDREKSLEQRRMGGIVIDAPKVSSYPYAAVNVFRKTENGLFLIGTVRSLFAR